MTSVRAFSLVEVAIAVGLVAFCLIAVLGLLPAAVQSNRASLEQTQAAAIMATVDEDLRSVPLLTNSPLVSPRFRFSAAGSNGLQTRFLTEEGLEVANAQSARYRVSVVGPAPAPQGTRGARTAWVAVSWPALADPNPSLRPTNTIGLVETLVLLDRP